MLADIRSGDRAPIAWKHFDTEDLWLSLASVTFGRLTFISLPATSAGLDRFRYAWSTSSLSGLDEAPDSRSPLSENHKVSGDQKAGYTPSPKYFYRNVRIQN